MPYLTSCTSGLKAVDIVVDVVEHDAPTLLLLVGLGRSTTWPSQRVKQLLDRAGASSEFFRFYLGLVRV